MLCKICLRNSSCPRTSKQHAALTFLHCSRWQHHFPLSSGYRHGTATPSAHTTKFFHSFSTALSNQYAHKPQELVLLCFQTRSDSNYQKMYCTTKGVTAIYFRSQPKWKTLSQSPISLCAGPKTLHGGSRFGRARL